MGREMRKVGLLLIACCLGITAVAWSAPPAAPVSHGPAVTVDYPAGGSAEALAPAVRDSFTAWAVNLPAEQDWRVEAKLDNPVVVNGRASVTLAASATPADGK